MISYNSKGPINRCGKKNNISSEWPTILPLPLPAPTTHTRHAHTHTIRLSVYTRTAHKYFVAVALMCIIICGYSKGYNNSAVVVVIISR
jgi:hypothetical protein